MNLVKEGYPVGVSLVVSKVADGITRLVKLAGGDEAEAERIMGEIEPIADRAAERMRADRKRGR